MSYQRLEVSRYCVMPPDVISTPSSPRLMSYLDINVGIHCVA